jgi:hypothetical protein
MRCRIFSSHHDAVKEKNISLSYRLTHSLSHKPTNSTFFLNFFILWNNEAVMYYCNL